MYFKVLTSIEPSILELKLRLAIAGLLRKKPIYLEVVGRAVNRDARVSVDSVLL